MEKNTTDSKVVGALEKNTTDSIVVGAVENRDEKPFEVVVVKCVAGPEQRSWDPGGYLLIWMEKDRDKTEKECFVEKVSPDTNGHDRYFTISYFVEKEVNTLRWRSEYALLEM